MKSFEEFSFMHVCNYLNKRVRIIGKQNGKYFKGVSKTKRKEMT